MRDIESVKTEKFKFEHDKFLELIPDEPKMPNYVTASGSNSIIDQVTHLRAQGIYRSPLNNKYKYTFFIASNEDYQKEINK